jgi:hypothetical protein
MSECASHVISITARDLQSVQVDGATRVDVQHPNLALAVQHRLTCRISPDRHAPVNVQRARQVVDTVKQHDGID